MQSRITFDSQLRIALIVHCWTYFIVLYICYLFVWFFFSFQMSNVEAGGGTVFTQVGTTLFPSQVREMLIV